MSYYLDTMGYTEPKCCTPSSAFLLGMMCNTILQSGAPLYIARRTLPTQTYATMVTYTSIAACFASNLMRVASSRVQAMVETVFPEEKKSLTPRTLEGL